MSPKQPVIRFFYDVVSPYSFVAFTLLRRLRSQWGFELVLEPVFLGFVLSNPTVNTPPPAFNKQKLRHMGQDLARVTAMHKFTMNLPKVFPANTLKAQRMLFGVKTHADAKTLEETTANLYKAYWEQGQDMNSLEVLAAALPAGCDKERLLNSMNDDAVKKGLVTQCEEAVKKGMFGTPTMFVTRGDGQEQMFFGSDRMDHLAYFLGKELPPVQAAKL
ncbi:DSBA-like thioredoxin domain-containing protein [Powellomyces hirtus]|nr:DSBA-like thioredoxin domain-containing protein [Powellomyces hirtus]